MLENKEILNLQQELNARLTNVSQVLYNSSVLLYQNILQNNYKNFEYDRAVVNYDYVPIYYQFINFMSFSQIGDVIQNYTNNVNELLVWIRQNGLDVYLQSKVTALTQSISTLNNFAVNLYNNQQSSIYTYIIPYDMSLRTALVLNKIDLSKLDLILLYNIGSIQTTQFLQTGFNLILVGE